MKIVAEIECDQYNVFDLKQELEDQLCLFFKGDMEGVSVKVFL